LQANLSGTRLQLALPIAENVLHPVLAKDTFSEGEYAVAANGRPKGVGIVTTAYCLDQLVALSGKSLRSPGNVGTGCDKVQLRSQ
jgi:hypothetical protein